MDGPININTSQLKYDQNNRIKLNYSPVIYNTIPDQYDNINLTYKGYDSYIVFNNIIYYLRNINFWRRSLHEIDENSYSMEVQLIHKVESKKTNTDVPQYVVICLLVSITTNQKNSSLLFDIINEDTGNSEFQINFNKIISNHNDYYHYNASNFLEKKNVEVFIFGTPIYIYKKTFTNLEGYIERYTDSIYNATSDVFINSHKKKTDDISITCTKLSKEQDDIDSIFFELNNIRYEKFRDIVYYILHYFLLFIIVIIALKINISIIGYVYKMFQMLTDFYCSLKVI